MEMKGSGDETSMQLALELDSRIPTLYFYLARLPYDDRAADVVQNLASLFSIPTNRYHFSGTFLRAEED